MLGSIIVVVVLLVVIPGAVLLGGAVVAWLLGFFLRNEVEAAHEGSELVELNR